MISQEQKPSPYTPAECKSIGSRFKLIRERLGKTLSQVAHQVGISEWQYSLLEAGALERLEAALVEKVALSLGIVASKILKETISEIKPKVERPVEMSAINKKPDPKEALKAEGLKLMEKRKGLGLSRVKVEKLAALPVNSLPCIELKGECLWDSRIKQIHKALDNYKPGEQDEKPKQAATFAPPKEKATKSPFEIKKEYKLTGDGFELIASTGADTYTLSIANGKEMLVFDGCQKDKHGFLKGLLAMIEIIEGK